jgi:hypothetical protein
VGLDSVLASNYSRDSDRDRVAREVSEGAAIVSGCPIRMAFLGGLRGARLASATARQFLLCTLDGKEALIERCFPENIAR